MNRIKTTTLASLGSEDSNVPTSRFILGYALIDLNGLSTLNALRAVIPVSAPSVDSSERPVQTTIKSSQFQGSRK